MRATLIESERQSWLVKDGADDVYLSMSEDGLHVQRIRKSAKGKDLVHAEEVLKYGDLISKAEGQAVMKL